MVGTLAPAACTFELRKKAWRVQDAYKEKDSHGVAVDAGATHIRNTRLHKLASWQARRPAGTLGMEFNVYVPPRRFGDGGGIGLSAASWHYIETSFRPILSPRASTRAQRPREP